MYQQREHLETSSAAPDATDADDLLYSSNISSSIGRVVTVEESTGAVVVEDILRVEVE